jgi:hypothetical protein
MFGRRGAASSATLVLCAVLAACAAPAPEPTPALIPFTGADAAYAAAEATYRGYIDALNEVDLGDPQTLDDLDRWTTGTAAVEQRESLTRLDADGWTSGGTGVEGFTGEVYAADGEPAVVAGVCVDVSNGGVLDVFGVAGKDAGPLGRVPLRVTFMRDVQGPFGLRIARTVPGDECG